MSGYQLFIVWGNGEKYIDKILNEIRNYENINIQIILKKKINNINEFVKHIYKFDKNALKYLNEKTQYLHNTGNNIYLIIVKNNNLVYKTKKNNKKFAFHETILKWKIRILFNPQMPNVNHSKCINNIKKVIVQEYWDNNITHNHVIHCTDFEYEFAHILKYFNMDWNDKKIKHYITTKNIFHPEKYKVINIDIDQILCNTVYKDNIKIKDSPHYKYLLGDKNLYKKYIIENLGLTIKQDHLPEAYDKLINKFNYGKIINGIPSYIIVEKKNNNYLVLDGLHRLSILLSKNVKNIKAFLYL